MTPIFIFIGSLFWTILSGVAIFLLVKFLDHEKRIQKTEDVQGSELKNLKTEFHDFKREILQKIDALTLMVHKDKNAENQLNATLSAILNHLTDERKDHTVS